MPSASANIMAKFIAQMETGTSWLISTSDPADATRPDRVSSSGSPAATSAPKARTRIARVTGHENSSDLSIASRLASLKSDHSRDDPVGLTSTPEVDRSSSGPLRSSATRTISLVSAPAPASSTAVLPSALIVAPGCGGKTCAIRGSPSSIRVAAASTSAPSPSVTGPSVLRTTTWIAEDALPPNLSWAASRTCTDSEPSACQPAPDSSASTRGAKIPRPTTSSNHTTPVSLRCSLTHTPRRPRGPGRRVCCRSSSTGAGRSCVVVIGSLPVVGEPVSVSPCR